MVGHMIGNRMPVVLLMLLLTPVVTIMVTMTIVLIAKGLITMRLVMIGVRLLRVALIHHHVFMTVHIASIVHIINHRLTIHIVIAQRRLNDGGVVSTVEIGEHRTVFVDKLTGRVDGLHGGVSRSVGKVLSSVRYTLTTVIRDRLELPGGSW